MTALEMPHPFSPIERHFRAILYVLDHLHLGAMILSSHGTLLCSNLSAQRILEQNDGLYVNGAGCLASKKASTHARLADALKASSRAGGAHPCLNSGTIVPVPRKSGKAPYLVEFTPLRDEVGGIDEGFCSSVVFVIDSADASRFSTRCLKALYGLTDGESDICALVVDGLTNQQIALTRHVSPETVKSHVHALLRKTGTANRSALVRLAVTVSIPADPAT